MTVVETVAERAAAPAGEELIRIGEVARGAGVSVRAVRYYEEQGLLTARRSASGQRLYPRQVIENVRFFQQMYAAGLTSKNIAELLPCLDTGHTDAEQRAMLHAERERIRGKIAELQVALRHLDSIIEVTSTHP